MLNKPTARLAAFFAIPVFIASCGGGGGSGYSGPGVDVDTPVVPVTPVNSGPCPVARVVSSGADLVPGPLARGRIGDVVIENTELRAIIQQAGRNWFNIGQFGGNIIDAVPKDATGALAAEDHYEEASLGTNIESSPNYQTVEIVDAGGSDGNGGCRSAIVRATGPDDLLDFVNASSAIRDMGFQFPDSADDVDLPLTISTDYVLDPDQSYISINTRLINDTATAQSIYLAEYMNGSGELELFQYGYGFGEVLITAPCASCRGAVYAGHEGGAGVSYGLFHNYPNSSSMSVSGVTIPVYGSDALYIALAGDILQPPPHTVPANGELLVPRWFAVGDGGVSSVMDVQYQVLGTPTGTVQGFVGSGGVPVAGAEITVISNNSDFATLTVPTRNSLTALLPGQLLDLIDGLGLLGQIGLPRGPNTIVANQFRTAADGTFRGQLPVGNYTLRINVPGRAAPTPAQQAISVTAGGIVNQVFEAPLPARLQVNVSDTSGQAMAAKVQLIGVDTSPDAGEPQNSESIAFGVLTVDSGIFGDMAADKLPNGVVLSEFAVHDPQESGVVTVGTTGELEVEPGEYLLSVSRGPRYSAHEQVVTLTAGQLSNFSVSLAEVVPTPGYVLSDFHVHSFNSPDSEVTNRERVATYLAEDMDFFTPSDHGMRVDFNPVIDEMAVQNRIASAPSAETTTFDYGHFNAWPTRIDQGPASADEPSQSSDRKISLGATDWGGAAPAGEDFPSAGHYTLSPEAIFADMHADPYSDNRSVVVQVNHVDSHFGAGGLEVDTGQTPPRSTADPRAKRLNPAVSDHFSANFDSLELWIGVDGREHQFEQFLGENLGDYVNLLNQGIVKTLIGNSDTHDRRQTSLSTRNYVAPVPSVLSAGRASAQALRADPHAIADAVLAGKSTASNSLFMEVTAVNAAAQEAGLSQSHAFGAVASPLPVTAAEQLRLNIALQSPTWAEYDRIEVFMNSATQRHVENGSAVSPARYHLCAPLLSLDLGSDFSRNTVTALQLGGVSYERFESQLAVDIPAQTEDFWLLVLARGRDGVSKPLWPVVPNDFSNGDGDLRAVSAQDRGTVAMAASNPLFFDVGGDGWQAPGVTTYSGSGGNSCPTGIFAP